MPYNPNIPQGTDIISQSQPQILANFQEINTLIAVNHATFGTPNEGKHNIVTLPNNAAPTPTLINEASIYSANNALTTNTELYWQRANNGTTIPFTAFENFGGAGGSGWTYLPSGLLIKWGGLEPTLNTGPTTINFETPPVFTTVFSVVCSVFDINNVNAVVSNILPASFQVNTFTANTGSRVASTITYLAIGI